MIRKDKLGLLHEITRLCLAIGVQSQKARKLYDELSQKTICFEIESSQRTNAGQDLITPSLLEFS